MNILDSINTCRDAGLANILGIIKKVLDLIQLIGPIIAIISLILILIKYITNPENKKLKGNIKNVVIALALLYFIPLLVNVTMGLLDDNFDVAVCWNYAEQAKNNGESSYIDPDNKGNSSSIISDPDDYDQGEERKSDKSNNNGNGASNSGGNTSISKYILVGDSRTVQMKHAIAGGDWSCSGNGDNWSIHGNDVWSCKGSMGLNWMKSNGIPQIEAQISNGSAIVILMGVNDLYQPDGYINYINSNVDKWINKGATVYFASVMPCDGKYSNLNPKISSFNTKLKSGLSSKVKWLDLNSYLSSNGFKATDGLHYDSATYKKIYSYIKSNL